MHASANAPKTKRRNRRRWVPLLAASALVLLGAVPPAQSQDERPAPVALALFAFELEDVSAAGALDREDDVADARTMRAVTAEARRVLEASGRYRLVDVETVDDAPPSRKIWPCDGCEARIARASGADQALAGVVRRVAQTEYYVALRLVDARTGRVIEQPAAFFIGSEDAWKSGVRSLLRRSVLVERPAH